MSTIRPLPGVAARLDAIREALALLPAKQQHLPAPIAGTIGVFDAIRAMGDGPSVFDIAGRIAAHNDPDTLPALLDQLDAEKRRRDLINDARNGGLHHKSDAAMNAAIRESVPELLDRFRPVFTDAAATLATAAAKLPDGPAALDPAAILEADARSPYRQARDALDTLEAIVRAVPVLLHHDGSTPVGSLVVTVANVPNVGPALTDGLTNGILNPPEEAEAIRAVGKLVKDFAADATLTLLGIARCEYPGVELSLPADAEALADRVERIATAHKVKRVEPRPEHEANARANARAWRVA